MYPEDDVLYRRIPLSAILGSEDEEFAESNSDLTFDHDTSLRLALLMRFYIEDDAKKPAITFLYPMQHAFNKIKKVIGIDLLLDETAADGDDE